MKQEFKDAAIAMIERDGLINLDREKLCAEMDLPAGSFSAAVGMSFSAFVEELREEGHTGPHSDVERSRAHPALRREQILQAATNAAMESGFSNLSRPLIAERAGVSVALVSSYFGSLEVLKALVMENAVNDENVQLVAEGLGIQNETAKSAPPELRASALEYLANT